VKVEKAGTTANNAIKIDFMLIKYNMDIMQLNAFN